MNTVTKKKKKKEKKKTFKICSIFFQMTQTYYGGIS